MEAQVGKGELETQMVGNLRFLYLWNEAACFFRGNRGDLNG